MYAPRVPGGQTFMRADDQDLQLGEELLPENMPSRMYGLVKWVGRNL
jgi:hypothetical protein